MTSTNWTQERAREIGYANMPLTTKHSTNFPYNLDLQHEQFSTMQEGRFGFAPLKNPQFAADVAGGTGVWAFEFGMYTR